MDSAIWSRLPEDLLEVVAAKLAEGRSMKLRLVSRKWKKMICSLSGLCPPSLVDSLLFCAYLASGNHLTLEWFNSRTGSWDKRLLSFDEFHRGDYPGLTLLHNSEGVVASEGGVLCFETVHNILLVNPFTKCWRKLPRRLRHEAAETWRVAGMSCNEHTGHHIIVSFGFSGGSRERGHHMLEATQVYDSSTDLWSLSHMATPLRCSIWSTSMVNKVVFSGDYIYLLSSPFGLRMQLLLQIFSMKKKTWVEISVDTRSFNNAACAYLITLHDKIYLVAEEGRPMVKHYLSFWELDTSNVEDLWTQGKVMWQDKILWHGAKRIHFDALAAMTCGLLIPRDVYGHWGCVVHQGKIYFLFPSTNNKNLYNIYIEHDMQNDSWRLMDIDKPIPKRYLWSFRPSDASVLPGVHSLATPSARGQGGEDSSPTAGEIQSVYGKQHPTAITHTATVNPCKRNRLRLQRDSRRRMRQKVAWQKDD